jgi:hypothetical protein
MKFMWIKWSFIFIVTLPAWGYNLTQDFLNGFYWASLPVKIIVSESDVTRKALLTEIAQSAIGEWEQKTGATLWNLSGSGTNNLIRWSTNFAQETRMDASSVLAIAIRHSNGPYFAKTEIIINGNHSSFNTGSSYYDKMNINTTLVHELGHTIGLDHSNDMSAVMAPSLQFPYSGLQADDIQGMQNVIAQTQERQITKYVSPLAYAKETHTVQPLSCGTTGALNPTAAGNNLVSIIFGLLIGLIRKIVIWVKSRL